MAHGTLKNLYTARSTDEPSLLPAVPMGYRSHACQGSHKKLGLPGFLWVYFGGCPAVGVLYGGCFLNMVQKRGVFAGVWGNFGYEIMFFKIGGLSNGRR